MPEQWHFRIFTVIDSRANKCLGLVAETSLCGERIARDAYDYLAVRAPSDDHQRQRQGVHVSRRPD